MPTRRALEFMLATGIRPIAGAWMRLADTALASLEISNSQGWALVHLARMQSNVSQADLARAIGITEASLVTTLHQLESAGYVTRQPDPDDRRTNRLVLTEAGSRIVEGIDQRLVAMRSDLLDGVSDAELATTVEVLERVGQRIVEQRGKP